MNVIEAMNTEKITYEIQQMKATKTSAAAAAAGKSSSSAAGDSAGPPSLADTTLTEEDVKSMASLQSESGVHASQIATPSPFAAAGESTEQDGGAQPARKTKRQLWDDVTISCKLLHLARFPPTMEI